MILNNYFKINKKLHIFDDINKLCLIVKSRPHKQHIWFLPIRKPTLKTKRAVFCQRLTEKICKFAF